MSPSSASRRIGLVAALVASTVGSPATGSAQCLLANPSFELPGTDGAVFAGWNHFGPVVSTDDARHGADAATVSGQAGGTWAASGVWQPLDSAAGDRWEVTVELRVEPGAPLTGGSLAIVNVEWRDASDILIDFESHPAADAATPTEAWRSFSFVTGSAPAGTASARLLLGVLHDPSEASPSVTYDVPTFFASTSPSLDERQWADFPGGRELEFAGYTWRVKGDGWYGPGPNQFEDDPDHVWVDAAGLHLTIRNAEGAWSSTEIALEDPLGYGDYVFTTTGRLDLLDSQAVLGLFIWQYGPCWSPSDFWWNPYNEMDIEFSRWGDPANPDIGHFTVQPWDWAGNGSSYAADFDEGEVTTHAMRWLPDRVEFRSWRGGPDDEATAPSMHSFTYTGPHIARPEFPRVHMNLWHIFAPPAADQSVVVSDFRFVPSVPVSLPPSGDPAVPPGRLLPLAPNPFATLATVRFELRRPAAGRVFVFDVSGRQVRELQRSSWTAGTHALTWDGRDDHGRTVAAGVYFVRLATDDFVETRESVKVP